MSAGINTCESHINNIGNKIKHYRINMNMTQQEMADISGVSMRSISRLEQGASVQLDSLIKIMMALKLDNNIDMLIPDMTKKHLSHQEKASKIRHRVRKIEKKIVNLMERGTK